MDDTHIHGADEMAAQLQAAIYYITNDAPMVVGVEAVKHFKGNIRKGVDVNGNKFKGRKTPRSGSTNGQGTLILNEYLIDSLDYRVQGWDVTIFTDLIYAQIHNEGGEITVTPGMRAHFWKEHFAAKQKGESERAEAMKLCALAKKIVIPQRQFLGDSPELDHKIEDKITRDLNKIFKQ